MVSETTFIYLTEYYSEAMRKEYAATLGKVCKEKNLQSYGKYDRRYADYREGNLWTIFDKVMCGDEKTRLIRCDRSGRSLYAYNGRWWESIDFDGFMKELVKRVFKSLEVGVRYLPSCDRIARELQSSVKSSSEYLFCPDRRYVVFANCVFDLKDGTLKNHDPRYVTDLVLDIDYMRDKECDMKHPEVRKRWERFICGPDGVFTIPEVARDFQVYCGAFLMDREVFKFEYMACVHGPGSNGKSVLVDAVSGVFGEDYYSTFTPSQLFREGTNSTFCISDLQGKLINIVGDLDNSDFSGGAFKQFISGAKIRARDPYGRSFRFVKPPLMICCANEFPEAADDSDGHHRRLLPFESTHRMWTERDKDPNLTAKLTTPESRAFIFNWMYRGYRRVVDNGGRLPLSDYTLEAQARLKANANSMRRWFTDSEWCVPDSGDPGILKTWKSLWDEYVAYCDANYYNKRNKHEFTKMLKSLLGDPVRRGNGMNYCVGRKKPEYEGSEGSVDNR